MMKIVIFIAIVVTNYIPISQGMLGLSELLLILFKLLIKVKFFVVYAYAPQTNSYIKQLLYFCKTGSEFFSFLNYIFGI